MTTESILVVLTSGLERIVPALGALAAIKAAHATAEVVILARAEYAEFLRTSPYADDVWADDTIGSHRLGRWRSLRARLRAKDWARVYDLDATPHSKHLFWLLYGRRALSAARSCLAWCGVIPGTFLAWSDPHRMQMHVRDQWAHQLRHAGIPVIPATDLSWVARRVAAFNVPFRMNEPYVLVAVEPGPNGPWPRLGEFARLAAAEGRVLVAVGLSATEDLTGIKAACPGLVDLVGKASLNELVFLAWAAAGAVGADNGVMHLAAGAGCRSVVLYGESSDPALVGQRGSRVTILRRPHLGGIPGSEVLAALKRL
ncbi:MAG: glycosyltransferase family 9 protein [Rhodospirillaceae bacterium]